MITRASESVVIKQSKFTARTRNGTSAECLSQVKGDRIRGRGTESASGFGSGDRIRGGTRSAVTPARHWHDRNAVLSCD